MHEIFQLCTKKGHVYAETIAADNGCDDFQKAAALALYLIAEMDKNTHPAVH